MVEMNQSTEHLKVNCAVAFGLSAPKSPNVYLEVVYPGTMGTEVISIQNGGGSNCKWPL